LVLALISAYGSLFSKPSSRRKLLQVSTASAEPGFSEPRVVTDESISVGYNEKFVVNGKHWPS
jgi:hypothetical protein